tara:strand:+ start:2174 stop:2500 length:327 start_codon:yes stop_codon:yes gene_type:complete
MRKIQRQRPTGAESLSILGGKEAGGGSGFDSGSAPISNLPSMEDAIALEQERIDTGSFHGAQSQKAAITKGRAHNAGLQNWLVNLPFSPETLALGVFIGFLAKKFKWL